MKFLHIFLLNKYLHKIISLFTSSSNDIIFIIIIDKIDVSVLESLLHTMDEWNLSIKGHIGTFLTEIDINSDMTK